MTQLSFLYLALIVSVARLSMVLQDVDLGIEVVETESFRRPLVSLS